MARDHSSPKRGRHTTDTLLPAEAFDHPSLKRRPPYVPEHFGPRTFAFALRKSCAGLDHRYRRDPNELYNRIISRTLDPDDGPALRWMTSGLQFSTDFVRLHTVGRLTIEELAYTVRFAYGDCAPYCTWLNQWGRNPNLPLPSFRDDFPLERPDELVGLDVRDIPPDDDHRIDVDDTTYLKLNGHMYWLPTHLLEAEKPRATNATTCFAGPGARSVLTPYAGLSLADGDNRTYPARNPLERRS